MGDFVYASRRTSSPSSSTRSMSISSSSSSMLSSTTTTATSSLGSPPSQPLLIKTGSNKSDHGSAMSMHDFSSSTLRKRSFEMPSAYLSDEDLFGDDDAPYLREPPPPPRPAEAYLARPLLPPVVKPRQRSITLETERRRSDAKG